MKTSLKKSFVAAAICFTALLAGPASAVTVEIKEVGLVQGMASNGLLLPTQSSPANYWAGMQNILVDNSKLMFAFCIDPWEWSSSGAQPYSSSSNFDAYFGATRSSRIRELYSDAYSSTQLSDAGGKLNAAAFQLALWEIIGDSELNFASGIVQTVTATNPQIVSVAKALLDHLDDGLYGDERYTFQLYTNGKSMGAGAVNGFQDYLVANRVPEPSSVALLLLALGVGTGFSAARRRKQSAV